MPVFEFHAFHRNGNGIQADEPIITFEELSDERAARAKAGLLSSETNAIVHWRENRVDQPRFNSN